MSLRPRAGRGRRLSIGHRRHSRRGVRPRARRPACRRHRSPGKGAPARRCRLARWRRRSPRRPSCPMMPAQSGTAWKGPFTIGIGLCLRRLRGTGSARKSPRLQRIVIGGDGRRERIRRNGDLPGKAREVRRGDQGAAGHSCIAGLIGTVTVIFGSPCQIVSSKMRWLSGSASCCESHSPCKRRRALRR